MSMKRLLFAFLLPCLLAFMAYAETGKILILHTNDLHDHIRPGYEGVGGMPYVAGYIKDLKSKRQDVLVLDAGDVTEKGDLVSFETHSEIMYEAMGKAGYAATVPGNHDLHYDIARLRAWAALAPDMSMLCLNLLDTDGKPCFMPSKIFDVNGVKVGVIGVTLPKGGNTLEFKACGEAVRAEAERLRPDAHLLVVLGHLSSKDCADMSELAPSVQVFIGGHSHELLKEPIVAKKTGAIIVQAGEYARYVGHLEITVDLGTRKVVHSEGGVVEMRHDKTPCDEAMRDWIQAREHEVCPDAGRVVGRCEKPLSTTEAGALAAEALRWRAGAEIAFCHPGSIIRSGLPAGEVDVNALFLTGGQRGVKIVETTLTGKAIEDYLRSLQQQAKGQTEWAGFRGEVDFDKTQRVWAAHTDLEADRPYRVVLTEMEWQSRFEQVGAKSPDAAATKPSVSQFTFLEAITAYAEYLSKEGIPLDAHVRKLLSTRRLQRESVR